MRRLLAPVSSFALRWTPCVVLAGVVAPAFLLAQAPDPRRARLDVPGDLSRVAAGDLDGDGRQDLAVLDATAGTVTPCWGVEGGTFAVGEPFDSGASPYRFLVTDLDRDGRSDLVIGSIGADAVTVAFGAADRRPVVRRDVAVPAPVRDLAVADFDGDGLLDLALGGGNRGIAAIVSSGAGQTLRAPIRIDTPLTYPHALAAGDFDGDGNADLFVAGRETEPPYVYVYEGKGDGTFRDPVALAGSIPPIGRNFLAAVAADWDRDGLDETLLLLEVRMSPGGAPGTLFLIEPEAPGRYVPRALPVGLEWTWTSWMHAADVDSDGHPDLVGIPGRPLGTVQLVPGVADPATILGEPCEIRVASDASGAAAADLDGDGDADLAMTLPDRGRIEIALDPLEQCGLDAGCFDGVVGRCWAAARSADIAGPQRVEVLQPAPGGRARVAVVTEGETIVLEPEGGAFLETARFPAPLVTRGSAAADLDRDRDADLVVTDFTAGTVRVWLISGSGELQAAGKELPAGALPAGVTVSDLDADGSPDLVVALSGEDSVGILFGLGAAEFSAPVKLPAGPKPRAVAAGDIDGDGVVDLAVANEREQHVSILRGLGGRTFAEPAAEVVIADPRDIRVVDLTGDGRADVVVASHETSGVTILLSEGDSFRRRIVTVATGSRTTALSVADLNGDSLPEIVVGNASSGTVLVHEALAPGEYAREPLTLPFCAAREPGQPVSLDLGDLDGDGFTDLVAGDAGSGRVVAYRSLGCTAEPTFRRGDVDGDGAPAITDAVLALSALFLGGDPPACPDAADSNDDGSLNLTDPVFLLGHLFLGGPEPPAPGPAACGDDPTADDLDRCRPPCGAGG